MGQMYDARKKGERKGVYIIAYTNPSNVGVWKNKNSFNCQEERRARNELKEKTVTFKIFSK